MAWFGLSKPGAVPIRMSVPLFPLHTVLFPDGLLPLKIFEPRYLDMAAACMKADSPFGICLIQSGEETGSSAQPHTIGTLAKIANWDMEQLGILRITVAGQQRFRVLGTSTAEKLLVGDIELIPDASEAPFPDSRRRLLPLLERVLGDLAADRIGLPYRLDDAAWVGYRITEILPIQNLAKQKLLELDDPLARLEILERYLDQRKLLD